MDGDGSSEDDLLGMIEESLDDASLQELFGAERGEAPQFARQSVPAETQEDLHARFLALTGQPEGTPKHVTEAELAQRLLALMPLQPVDSVAPFLAPSAQSEDDILQAIVRDAFNPAGTAPSSVAMHSDDADQLLQQIRDEVGLERLHGAPGPHTSQFLPLSQNYGSSEVERILESPIRECDITDGEPAEIMHADPLQGTDLILHRKLDDHDLLKRSVQVRARQLADSLCIDDGCGEEELDSDMSDYLSGSDM